ISVAIWTLPRGGADIKRISKRQLERWGFVDSYRVNRMAPLPRTPVSGLFPDADHLARSQPPLLVHSDQCSRLGFQAVVDCSHRLVCIGEGGRHHDVELKLAGRNQAGELHRRRHAADGDGRQRRYRSRLRYGPTHHRRGGWSETIGVNHDRLAGLGGSGQAGIETGGSEVTSVDVGGGNIRPAIEDEERRSFRLRLHREGRAVDAVVCDLYRRRSGEGSSGSQNVHLRRADVVDVGRHAVYRNANAVELYGHLAIHKIGALPDARIAAGGEIGALYFHPRVRRNRGNLTFRVRHQRDGRGGGNRRSADFGDEAVVVPAYSGSESAGGCRQVRLGGVACHIDVALRIDIHAAVEYPAIVLRVVDHRGKVNRAPGGIVHRHVRAAEPIGGL